MPRILEKNGHRFSTSLRQVGSNVSAKTNQPFLLDLVTREYVVFMGLPTTISIDPSPNWYAILTPGRNLPFYHYTGNETTIEFELSWYSTEENRMDVIEKIKWIESRGMNDANNDQPHELLFSFGELFKDGLFILKKAPYQLGLFNREKGMYPQVAKQQVTLSRVSAKNPNVAQVRTPTY